MRRVKRCEHCGYTTNIRWEWLKHRLVCPPDDFPGWGYRTEEQRQALIDAGDPMTDTDWAWIIWTSSGVLSLVMFMYLWMTGGL